MHRRHELDERIKIFVEKCDRSIQGIKKLKTQARGFIEHLNCEPTDLKERFLNCMKQLDEYNYLITDFNLAVGKIDSTGSVDCTPVQDVSTFPILPESVPFNLLDTLSEPTPSTSKACSNHCPVEKPKRTKIPREDQLLITFSSNSCSSESVPVIKSEKEVQCEIVESLRKTSLDDSHTLTECNLPAQSVLQVDNVYPAVIVHADGISFWVITDSLNQICDLMTDMTTYYKENMTELNLDQLMKLTYCACYDNEDNECFYRGLFIKLSDDDMSMAEVFLVDTGETRCVPTSHLQPLVPQYATCPPFARCCHLAGAVTDVLLNSEELIETYLKKYIGKSCKIKVDDNTSESLGVYVIVKSEMLSNHEILNVIILNEGLALLGDNKSEGGAVGSEGLPKLDEDTFNTTTSSGCDDPVEYKMGYHNQAEINKHYKDGPDKTCYKGPRNNNTDIMKSSDDEISQKGGVVGEGLPELNEDNFNITDCPEHDDLVVAVTVKAHLQTLKNKYATLHKHFHLQGYHNRDEMDICKHYKGGPDKTCFKGPRCTKKHIMKHPDGWTLDQVPVVARCKMLPLPAPDTWHQVKVTHVAHFDHFYVHFVNNTKAPQSPPSFGVVLPPVTLEELVRDMNCPATRMAYKPLQIVPAPGELVAALYLDGLWYRARVISSTRADQNVEVLYIDYGNVVWVKEDAVRELEPRYWCLEAQACRCALAGVVATTTESRHWAAARERLTRLINERTLQAHVIARDYDEVTVELFDENESSIAEQLALGPYVMMEEYDVVPDHGVTQKIVVP